MKQTTCAIIAAAGWVQANAQPFATRTTIAAAGRPVPALGAGFTYGSSCAAATFVSENGLVIFEYGVNGPDLTLSNGRFLFAGSTDTPGVVVQIFDPAPGVPGEPRVFGRPSLNNAMFSAYDINNAGEIFGLGYVLTNGAWQNTLFAGDLNSLSFVAGNFLQAPDAPNGLLSRFLSAPMNLDENGLIGYIDGVQTLGENFYTADDNSAIRWFDDQSNAPGVSPASRWRFDDTPYMNNQASVALAGRLLDSPTANARAIFAGTLPLAPGVAARSGFPAPDLPNHTYGAFVNSQIRAFEHNQLRIANDRVIAFATRVTGPDTNAAIFLGLFDDIRLYAFNGMQAPDLPAGIKLASLESSRIELNGQASVAFTARLTGPGVDASNDSAIFEGPPGDIRLLIREGDTGPTGAVLADLLNPAYLAYNDRRQIAFRAFATNGFDGIYGTTPAGELVEFARQGVGFITDDGFSGGISLNNWVSLNTTLTGSPFDGRPDAFNNRGQLVATLCFGGSTGTGTFVFTAEGACLTDFAPPTGQIDFFDTLAFLSSADAGDPAADLDQSGAVTTRDRLRFLSLFGAGCE